MNVFKTIYKDELMNKLNKKLIKFKKRMNKIESLQKSLTNEHKLLQDTIHLYFDSKDFNTREAEKFIISDFWSKAYDKYSDGGYITNDSYISKVRFKYEINQLNNIIKESSVKKGRALDIGCGNGRYTKKFSKIFKNVVGLDLSKEIVLKNTASNKKSNIAYINNSFMNSEAMDKLGKFDFVFASDPFTYTNDKEIKNIFENLLKLLSPNGILLIRESTHIIGDSENKSTNYVAYYRNYKFYEKGIFEKTFQQTYRDYGYNLYHLNKYFNVNKKEKERVKQNPILLNLIVDKYVDKSLKTCHFFLHKQ